VLLFASERWRWFSFNQHTGYTVLLAVAIVGGVLLLLVAWMLFALVLRRRAQLKLRTLLVFVILCALVCGWMVVRLREVPFGHQELDWSDLVPPPGKRSSNAAQKLSDTKARVYIHGFMHPGRRSVGMSEFAIIRRADMDMFERTPPKASDVILVRLTDFPRKLLPRQLCPALACGAPRIRAALDLALDTGSVVRALARLGLRKHLALEVAGLHRAVDQLVDDSVLAREKF
jgi:hypothetical protein